MKIVAALVVVAVVCAGVSFAVFKPSEDTRDSITISYGNLDGWNAVLYAAEKDMYGAEGVKANSVVTADGGTAMSAVMSGKADITFVGLDPIINMSQNEDATGLRIVGTMMVPNQGIAHSMWNTSNVTTDHYVKKIVDGATVDDTTRVNYINDIVTADGALTGKKIGIAQSTAHWSYFMGYLQLLLNGGTSFNVEYPAGQITQAQYDTLKSKTCAAYVNMKVTEIKTALESGNVDVAIGPSAITANLDTSRFGYASNPGLIMSGFCVIVVSEKYLSEHEDTVVKVIRAIDKAAALIQSESTSYDVAKVCAKKIYGAEADVDSNITKYADKEIAYYKSVNLDPCTAKETKEMIEKTALAIGYTDFNASSIYDPVLEDRIMKNVHNGGKYQRTLTTGDFSSWEVTA